MNRITHEYRKFQGEIAVLSHFVISCMENNEAFPDPPAALEKLKNLVPKYRQALADAASRDKIQVSIKNDIKAEVLGLLQQLADYVTVTSGGDRTTMLSSGFNVNNGNGNNKKPPTIEILEIDLKVTGQATTRVRKVMRAIAFVHQYTPEPPNKQTIWISEGTSLSSYTFKGLESDKRYWFRVVAIGYYGLRSYSEIVSKVIQ
ncbi:hypothetical protein [Niastella sp. OAS944]|uniref:fibronectin type III domain-containing protein n=1 Tax=Niastella sp. OAS944 TaxID=2664089 RepID=UPI003476439C|nr:hypothetical protein [Chitinophagaceae bacterium OAS944]